MQQREGEGAIGAQQEEVEQKGIKNAEEGIKAMEEIFGNYVEGQDQVEKEFDEYMKKIESSGEYKEYVDYGAERYNIEAKYPDFRNIRDVWESIPENLRGDVIAGLLEKGDYGLKFMIDCLDKYEWFDSLTEDEQNKIREGYKKWEEKESEAKK